MKNYLTLAAILGAIAFISVSYLAQADEKMAAPPAAMHMDMDAPAPAPAPMGMPDPAVTATPFAVDSDMCSMLSSAPAAEGVAPSAEAKDSSFKKCMIGKGHTEEELKMAEDEMKAEDATKEGTATTTIMPTPMPDMPTPEPAAK